MFFTIFSIIFFIIPTQSSLIEVRTFFPFVWIEDEERKFTVQNKDDLDSGV